MSFLNHFLSYFSVKIFTVYQWAKLHYMRDTCAVSFMHQEDEVASGVPKARTWQWKQYVLLRLCTQQSGYVSKGMVPLLEKENHDWEASANTFHH